MPLALVMEIRTEYIANTSVRSYPMTITGRLHVNSLNDEQSIFCVFNAEMYDENIDDETRKILYNASIALRGEPEIGILLDDGAPIGFCTMSRFEMDELAFYSDFGKGCHMADRMYGMASRFIREIEVVLRRMDSVEAELRKLGQS